VQKKIISLCVFHTTQNNKNMFPTVRERANFKSTNLNHFKVLASDYSSRAKRFRNKNIHCSNLRKGLPVPVVVSVVL